ncbi:penicillin-binding protein [Bacteroidota bacterium]
MSNSRILFIVFIILSLFMVLFLELINIQLTKNDYYTTIAENQQNKFHKTKAERGIILDSKNNVLAYTQSDVSIYVDKRMLKNESRRDSLLLNLLRFFPKNKNHYLSIINSGEGNICLVEKTSLEKANDLMNLAIDALFIIPDHTRLYTYGSLASHILGYVNKDCDGVTGIEIEYNEILSGEDGFRIIENDVTGRIVSIRDDISMDAKPGNDIILTINKDFQRILELELQSGLEMYGGTHATGIIMDPNTGEILALANSPDYYPANFSLYTEEIRRNRSICDLFEPGSIIKPFILAMLLEEDLISLEEKINTENGVYNLHGVNVSDTHPYKSLSIREIIERSSNIGISKISSRVNKSDFYKYLRSFGFGNKIGVDLPGEAVGILKKPSEFTKISQQFISFGYEISVSPIQFISSFSSLINGGKLYRPFIVKKIVDYSGTEVKSYEPKLIRNTISLKSSDILKDLLIGVVEDGTAKNSRMNDVLVGGKTGTAQKFLNNKYSNEEYNSSFIGFLPAEEPQLICLIMVSSPKIGKYGGQVAAPIFKNIMSKIIYNDITIIPDNYRITRENRYINELFSGLVNQNNDLFNLNNLRENKNENNIIKKSNNDNGRMPDLTNSSMREALIILNQLSIKYKISGSGFVVTQSILPGVSINKNAVCLLHCEPSNQLSNLRIH